MTLRGSLMKASDLFVQCLEQEGVEVVFGIPGVETLDLVDSLSRSGIRFVSARQEGGAAFMADVYGRVTGRAGVCLAGAGAASTNMTTALAGATLNHAPVVAITGQKKLARIQREDFQVLDIVATLKPVTKWNTLIGRPELIPALVHKAFKIAQTETLGACHLDLPEDVAAEEVNGRPFPAASLRRPSPPDRVLDGAAELIDNSEKVVILAGHGAVRGDASEELAEFVATLGFPVLSTAEGKGILPFDHPNFCYTVDSHTEEEGLHLLKEADLVITVGYELDEFPPDLWNSEGKAKIVHMSASPSEVSRCYMVNVEIVADIRDSLRNLQMMVCKPRKLVAQNGLKKRRQEMLKNHAQDEAFPLKPQRILADLARVMKREDLMVCDMGSHREWVSQYFPAPGAGSVILSTGYNATGFALPGAIGAKVANPERRVMALCGDGGFLSGCAELATASAMNLPIVVLIFNDRQMSYVRSLQSQRFQQSESSELLNPDFAALARSFGAQGVPLGKGDDLAGQVEEAFSRDQPTVIDIPVDAAEQCRIFENWIHSA